jgi:sugar phosphate permease
MGIVASSTGIGSTVVCILQTAAIERAGFRASYFLAAILLASCAVIAILFVRSHPAKMGMLPYGDGERIEQKKREQTPLSANLFSALSSMIRSTNL